VGILMVSLYNKLLILPALRRTLIPKESKDKGMVKYCREEFLLILWLVEISRHRRSVHHPAQAREQKR
jgi:hypothetical protein